MLELIVLGRVPGTHIQLTLYQVVNIGLLLMIMLLIAQEIKNRRAIVLKSVPIRQIKRRLTRLNRQTA